MIETSWSICLIRCLSTLIRLLISNRTKISKPKKNKTETKTHQILLN